MASRRRSGHEDGEVNDDSSTSDSSSSSEADEPPTNPPTMKFKNDGSFLEMFKKMQEQKAKEETQTSKPQTAAPSSSKETETPPLPKEEPVAPQQQQEPAKVPVKKPGLMSVVSSIFRPSEGCLPARPLVELQRWDLRPTERLTGQSFSNFAVQVGKRRGGKILPTGIVKKQRRPEDEEEVWLDLFFSIMIC